MPLANGLCHDIVRVSSASSTPVPHRRPPSVLGRLCPSARQSEPRSRAGKEGQGDTWLREALGQAANNAARIATFLGECYGRIAAAAAMAINGPTVGSRPWRSE